MALRLKKNNELLLASIFMLSNISGLLTELFDKLGLNYPTSFVFIIIFSIAISAWIKMFFIKPQTVVIVFIAYAMVVLFSIILEPKIQTILFNFNGGSLYDFAKSEISYVILLCLSLFVLGFGKAKMDVLFSYLRKYSLVSTIIFTILTAVTILNGTRVYNYMPIAYNALPGICILLMDSKLSHSTISKFWIVGAVAIFVGGCRGALVSIAVLWVLLWLKSEKKVNSQRVIKAVLGFVLAMVVFVNLPFLATQLGKFLATFGYSSRIVESIIASSETEGFWSLSTRNPLQTIIIDNINLFGHGIYSDRIVLDGTYPHNIILEIIYHFGLLFGIPIIIFCVCLLVHIYRVASYKHSKYLMVSWLFLIAIICVKLMVSSTYLSDLTFWFCIGLVSICFRNDRQSGDKYETLC